MINILISRFRDKKKFIINYLILLFSCLFIILSFYLFNYFEYCINKSLNKSIENKMITVEYFDTFNEQKIEDMCNLKYVVMCYEEYANWEFIVNGHNLLLDNYVNNDHTILYGRLIENKYEVIVSNYIVDNMDYDLGDSILYNDIEFKVVGIVDEDLPFVYGDSETVRYIANFNNGIVSNVILFVDNYENTLDVIKKLDDIGYDSTIVGNINSSEKNLKDIIESLKFGVYIIVFISIIIIFAVFLHINNCEKRNGALLRLLGYSTVFISIVDFLYHLFFGFFLFIFYFLLYFLTYIIFVNFNIYIISFDKFLELLLFIMIIIMFFISIYFFYNLLNYKTIDVLKIIEED